MFLLKKKHNKTTNQKPKPNQTKEHKRKTAAWLNKVQNHIWSLGYGPIHARASVHAEVCCWGLGVLRPNVCDRAVVTDAQVEHPEFSKVGMVLCLDSPPQPLNDTTNTTESAKALTVVFFFPHLDIIRNPGKPYQKPSCMICTLNRHSQQHWMDGKHCSQHQEWILLAWHF